MTAQSDDQYMPNEEILRIAEEIVADTSDTNVKITKYRSRYGNFAERYPFLFLAACEPNFDMNRLRYMLQMKEAVDKQRLTQHQASVEVGTFMYNEYVKPIVDNNAKNKPKN